MKTFLISLFSICTLTAINSQTEKGRWMIGNNVRLINTPSPISSATLSLMSFSTNSVTGSAFNQDVRGVNIGLGPNLVYFVANNLSLGFMTNFQYSTVSDETFTNRNLSFGLGPQAQFFIGSGKVCTFVKSGVLFGRYNSTRQFGTSEFKDTYAISNFHFGIGAAIFLNQNCAVNIEGLYNFISFRDRDNNDRERINGLGLDIGITIFL